MTDLY
jgi:hypothetical protein